MSLNIGVSGHQIRQNINWVWVRNEIRSILENFDSVSGIWTSLATGSDTIAAEAALELSIPINVVIPHGKYEEVFSGLDRIRYEKLLSHGSIVERIKSTKTRQEAYLLAGYRVVDRSEQMIIVWDGSPAAGLGGTADIMSYATEVGKPTWWLDTTHGVLVPPAKSSSVQ